MRRFGGVLFFAAFVGVYGAEAELDGAKIFAKKCASCHDYYIPQLRLNENYEHNNTLLKLKAPTLTELSFRLKDQVGDRKGDAESQIFEIEAWLGDFLKNPSAFKTILPVHVRKRFETMPSVKLSEEEVEALAPFMYDYAEKMMTKHGVKRYRYDEALKKAKTEGKIVMIEGYLPYCRWCVRMDREVMVEPEVKAMLDKHFVLVKMNLATQKLPLGMRRLGTPSFYFIDPVRNEVIDMVEGFGDKKEFLELLGGIVEAAKR
jgi:thioredoxin-related protein